METSMRSSGLSIVGKPIHQWHPSWPAHATTGAILRLTTEAKRLIDWKFGSHITSGVMSTAMSRRLVRELAPEKPRA